MTAKKTSPRRNPKKRLLLVDDHPMMREGLAHLINRQVDLMVCSEADDAHQAMKLINSLKPDLALVDVSLEGKSGIELIKDLRVTRPDLPVLVISMHDELLYAERVLRAGARGYIMKQAGGDMVLRAIRQVLGGEVYLSSTMSARVLDNVRGRKPRGSHSPIETISDREFEVFQLIGQGKSTRDIAKQLRLSPKTVDVHRGHIKEKMQLKGTTALVLHAVRWVETQKTGA
jgi:DNA-binding NarL/FixJ family response regulator